MAINLNNPYGMVGIQPEIGTITPPPTPAPTIPGFTGFGDRLATIGGFGDDSNELKTQEELAKMTQAQIDEYTKKRKMARRSGVSEALIQFGEALQGKPATENALKRKQALQNMEMQKQYQAEYQSAIQAAEQTNPNQARLLKSLGLPGFVNLQQKRAEQMFLGSGKTGSQERFGVYGLDDKLIGTVLKSDQATIAKIEQNPNQRVGQLRSPTIKSPSSVSDPLRTITMGGKVIKNVRDSELTTEEINKINKSGQVIQPLGFTEKFESNKDVNFEPIKKKYLATENIIIKTSELAQKFYDEPTSALAVGRGSQFVDSVIQNLDQGLNLISSAKDKKSYQYLQKTSKSLSGKDFSDAIKQASQASGVAESRIRDLGYLFAAARGQEGRGLSDKDFENALKIVSGGVGAEGRAMVLQDVSNSLRDEFYRDVNFDIQTSENQAYVDRLTELPQLPTFVMPSQAMPIAPSAGTPSVEDLLNKYGG
jgi:hypothetical protein